MTESILDRINSPADIKNLNPNELNKLCASLRKHIIKTTLENGGHLASSLGVVELTVALHLVFDTPKDKIIWDVGHQSYAHKLLTGRADRFDTLRKLGGLSGFPKYAESPHDAFDTGHSSTSISAALGLARARDIKGGDEKIIAVIGDGALTGGMSYEALNDAGQINSNLIVVLNDNDMSISHNVGGMSNYLSRIRLRPGYTRFKRGFRKFLVSIPLIGNSLAKSAERLKNRIKYFILPKVYFEEIGFAYLGPIDGHNIKALIRIFMLAKQMSRPVFIHVVTSKGKGYKPAEQDPEHFHGVAPFLIEKNGNKNGKSCSETVGEVLRKLAAEDERVVAITAAMPGGTGLSEFAKEYPNRFFDVGIAEQHAVTMAAGMARGGLRPYFAVYSTFLQRAYDQVVHDVCMQKLPVTLCVDRAGITGEDGETHQGIYDISMMIHMPNMVLMSPSNNKELDEMIRLSLSLNGPCAIRYPRGAFVSLIENTPKVVFGKWHEIAEPKDLTVIATGKMVSIVHQAINMDTNLDCGLINARFIKPFDEEILKKAAQASKIIVTVEDGTKIGGLGSAVAQWCAANAACRVINLGLPDRFIEQGTVAQLLEKYELTPERIREKLIGLENELYK